MRSGRFMSLSRACLPRGWRARLGVSVLAVACAWVPARAAEKFKPFVSDVMRGGQPARHVKVRVRGLKDLWLIAVGVPDNGKGYSDWGDARLIDSHGKVTYLSDLSPTADHRNYGGVFRDKRQHGKGPIRIGNRTFKRGIGTHADCEIRYRLDGRYEWFEAWIGIDAATGGLGHVRFTVSDRPHGIGRARPAGAAPVNTKALRLAVEDLTRTYPKRYPKGREYLRRLAELEKSKDRIPAEQLRDLRREALLANPLLEFDKLLLVKRRPVRRGRPQNPDAIIGWDLGFPRSSTGHSTLPKGIYDNEIAVLSPVGPEGKLTTLYKPTRNRFVGDVDLHFGADRMLFSMRDDRGRWQIHELRAGPAGVRQVTRPDQPDVDNYDACYLPDGRIIFSSSACFQSVPCNGSDVAVLYRMNSDGSNVRQLCFEQDHDFNPAVMPSGRVLYLRWEYSDLPHTHSRILFSMNPDGTVQREVYGSNSYWPNSLFGARAIPGHAGKVVGTVAGHHGSYREGELVLFDTDKARSEADGAVQRIPGHGKRVTPIIADQLTARSWPKFLHPYPLSDKYFLVACKLTARSPWDIYLVDVFDNLLGLHHVDGYALFEPIPLRKTPRPPVIFDRVTPSDKGALVYLMDVYRGRGLAGVPRGTVKNLRLVTYHFAYRGRGGLLGTVGMDGPWDVRRVIGTVPVFPDGSAYFRVPANTPIGVYPLDAQGKAVQAMRSWFLARPGEVLSCVGCHEPQSAAPPNLRPSAIRGRPSEITPWPGRPQGFSYKREVQPVIDRYCVRCHNPDAPPRPDGRRPADLSGTKLTSDFRSVTPGNSGGVGGKSFSAGYVELSRYVRRAGIESDLHVLTPMEFHADTTQLVQMLTKGHHGVRLEAEAWRRLITWIDLNAPYHGTWTEAGTKPGRYSQRRRELRKLYAGVDEDPESFANSPPRPLPLAEAPRPSKQDEPVQKPQCPGWPFDPAEAERRQLAAAGPASSKADQRTRRTIDLGGGVKMDLVLIPAGEFIMGDPAGCADEKPLARVRVDRPFWMGTCEVSNAQFARFDAAHDSRVESKNAYQFGVHGYPVNAPPQPVVRVSWREARAFCRWLGGKAGGRFALPTEAQWEYACRAGTAGAFWFGPPDADYSRHANVADKKLREFASDPYTVFRPLRNATKYDDWIPRDNRFNDGGLVTMPVGSYRPNAWSLRDMHGNAAEWTRTTYRPYPYRGDDEREAPGNPGRKVVRGGSWRDRPKRCRSAFRLSYPPWQRVYNVGFRVVCPAGGKISASPSRK